MKDIYKNIINKLKENLKESLQRHSAEGLLFSGGLDSSILAFFDSNIKTITVSFKSYGEDIKYSREAAKFLNLEHYQKEVDIEEGIKSIPEVIKILKTFDPAIPNDLVVYFGLRFAKEMGINNIMTGDGSDELFGGYSYMQNINMLDDYIKMIIPLMKFSSNDIGKFFDIKICQPYLDKEFVNFCLEISSDLKVRKEQNKIRGKWILRKTFEDILPKEIVWQSKRPLEHGSGMSKLRGIISTMISDEEFEEERKLNKVKFLNKEHFYYYKVYMDTVGEIPQPKINQKKCPGCGAKMNQESFHCRTCGNILNWRLSE